MWFDIFTDVAHREADDSFILILEDDMQLSNLYLVWLNLREYKFVV
mgnify:CR=1 FL=1